MGATEEKLAQFIANYPVEDIPPEILDLGINVVSSARAVRCL